MQEAHDTSHDHDHPIPYHDCHVAESPGSGQVVASSGQVVANKEDHISHCVQIISLVLLPLFPCCFPFT